MLLTRLHRPQFLSSAWTTALQLRHNLRGNFNSSSSQGDSETTVGDARPLKISKDRQKIKHLKLQQFKSKPSPSSLFEELFPDDTKKKKVVTLPKERQALDWAALSPWKPLHRETKDVFSPTGTGLQYDPTTPEYHKMRERRDASVLVLSNASKNLVESDFLRLSPKGEHIEGWSSGIIKVIPGRDPQTLESLGHYFILFSTPAAARAYQDILLRLHRLSCANTPKSMTSKLPPPPGMLHEGADLHSMIKSFTLIPSSQNTISIRLMSPPFSPAVRRLIIDGAPPALLALQTKSQALVLFSLDQGNGGNLNLSVADVKYRLNRDAKERNMAWGLFGGEDEIVQLQSRRNSDDENEGLEAGDTLSGRRKRRVPPRFVVSFRDVQEARRFVRMWHRRPFVLGKDRAEDDEIPPVVNAELLW